MREVMYDQSSVLIVGILFVSLIGAIEAGYRVGRTAQAHASESSTAHINAIQAAVLGILALLLGFTFSLSLQRFESRSESSMKRTRSALPICVPNCCHPRCVTRSGSHCVITWICASRRV